MSSGDTAQQVARSLIDRYYKTTTYPYTRHHIDSYDQFLKKDLPSILQSQNPVLLMKDLIDPITNTYRYKVEIYIGGESGTEIEIGTPTVSLQNTEEVRILFPNEARLRNLTYASTVYANILVKITYTEIDSGVKVARVLDPSPDTFQKLPLFKIPIMLHSRYCVLNGKPKEFLRQAGECPYDHGGYFVVGGAEKVLITLQEQAFNTLYITPQASDPKVKIYSSISCLNAETRLVKRVSIGYMRKEGTLQVSLPFVRKSIPLFVLFRALGFQSDEEILRMIYPDFEAPEAKLMLPKLHASIVDGYPFTNTYLSIQYIKTLTKGFSEAHVLDIIRNQMFIHMQNDPTSQALFLGDCVRRILRVNEGFDKGTDRDDIRNQRCLTSGFLVQMLFSNAYKLWMKAFTLSIDREYEANKRTLYKGENFRNIFQPGNTAKIFAQGMLTEGIMRGFKGKWGTGLGEEKSGVLQALSRLSYCDFISHCRRVILNFDTGMKLTGPRKLHPSQFGYFCTNETPSGSSIGVTKNLNVLSAISTPIEMTSFTAWLRSKGRVYLSEDVTMEQRSVFVPVYLNNGMFGYTAKPQLLDQVLKSLKRSGCLPYSISTTFSIRERKVQIFADGGRPLRPLIWLSSGATLPSAKLAGLRTWRDLVMGTLTVRAQAGLDATDFIDPYVDKPLEEYPTALAPFTGAIEYVDPYEHNESYIATFPEYIMPETTHVEVHPSTIMSIMTTLIPFPNHNQSPRNQLSCSQSKQGISIYASNWQNRFDNTAHVLCYGEAPLTRTIYTNYLGEGRMPYGSNIILAIACWTGYNQEDGIVFNHDAFQRGLFRSIAYRSYEAFEEDDEMAKVKTRFGNPALIASWKDLKPGLNYNKLDDRGIIKEGEYCDENTVLVGSYMTSELGIITDASITPQVWTTGRVDKIAVMVDNMGRRLVKIRLVQDRIPELGDKFCLTPDHEVLTNDGWKGIVDVTLDDKVCTLNGGNIEYANPTALYKFKCKDEELYTIKSQQVDLTVTKNHSMYVKLRHSKEYSLIEAQDIYGKRVSYKKNGTNINPEYQFKEIKLNMSAWLEFIGYWISNVTNMYEDRVEITQIKKRNREHIFVLIKDLGYTACINKRGLYINNKQLATYLYEFSNGMPEWVWKLSEVQCRLLIKGLVLNSGTNKFVTSSKGLLNDFQRLCLHAGWSANVYRRHDVHIKISKGANAYVATIVKSKNQPTVNHGHTAQNEYYEKYTGNVYCFEVPSHVFYVRRNGKPTWTGNSNRHGQKGTIGAMLRGHDMPRTINGIIPDMIMNPHAIPSRMTIAQNLEQLVGKAAIALGAVGDGTAFMNDGSPEEQIGKWLENMGYEKYGNDVMYNGATGEQIPASIFMGPVYGMRLKHMVEDKWQARGQGRKEQRTHQPTGGRGNQGGLKIGEMDRDSIIAHSMTSFYRESYMERSDGSTISLCTSCGTMPIYNPRLNIAMCPLCSGPAQYVGDKANTMELLPPISRPKGRIVNVELPYATKVLQQELATYMNIGMRFITTADTQALRPFELSATATEVIKELPKLTYPSVVVPELMVSPPEQTITVEQLKAMGADITATVNEADDEEDIDATEAYMLPVIEEGGINTNNMRRRLYEEDNNSYEGEEDGYNSNIMPELLRSTPDSQYANQIVNPVGNQIVNPVGNPVGNPQGPPAVIMQSALPMGPKIINIDTSKESMTAEGLSGRPQGGFRRGFPRGLRMYGGQQPQQWQQPQQSQQGQQQSQQSQPQQSGYSAPITVNKLG